MKPILIYALLKGGRRLMTCLGCLDWLVASIRFGFLSLKNWTLLARVMCCFSGEKHYLSVG